MIDCDKSDFTGCIRWLLAKNMPRMVVKAIHVIVHVTTIQSAIKQLSYICAKATSSNSVLEV